MATKLTDDIRILLALQAGYTVRNYYKAGFKWKRAPEYWSAIQEPGDFEAKWHRGLSISSIRRCKHAGQIVEIPHGDNDSYGHDITHSLTEAGRAAAAAIQDIPIAKALAAPKRAKVPDGLDFWGLWYWKEASEALKDMVRRGKYLREHRNHLSPEKAQYYELKDDAAPSWKRTSHVDPKAFVHLASYVESYEGPGWRGATITYYRPNAAGIDLVMKRQLLPAVPSVIEKTAAA